MGCVMGPPNSKLCLKCFSLILSFGTNICDTDLKFLGDENQIFLLSFNRKNGWKLVQG